MLQKLEGRFLRWQNSRSGQPQFIQIQTSTIIQSVRLGKNLQRLLIDLLRPGMNLSLQAKVKKRHLKAKFVVLLPMGEVDIPQKLSAPNCESLTVKVCTGKHCCKNGSQEIIDSLRSANSKAAINVQKVRCLGDCRHAPVVKISDRKYYRLSPQKVVVLALKVWQQLQLASVKSCR
jgi:hypothetical protein